MRGGICAREKLFVKLNVKLPKLRYQYHLICLYTNISCRKVELESFDCFYVKAQEKIFKTDTFFDITMILSKL